MAEEITTVESTPAAPAAEAAPVVAQPTEAPAAEPVVAEPTVEAPKAPDAAEPKAEDKKEVSLLNEEPKAEEPKTEDAPAEPKVEAEEGAEPALPTYEEFKLPEGFEKDDKQLGDFTKLLGEFEASKPDHTKFQEFGQKAIEFHVNAMKEAMERQTKLWTEAWTKQADDWKQSFLTSPEFANRQDTVLGAARDAISVYGGDATQQKEFRELMDSTKLGNHPAMIRMLSNIMIARASPKPLAPPQNAKPVMMSKAQKMYGKKN